jgi:hypothetical protein
MPGRIFNFLYNIDRGIASLFGANPQSTISREACKRRGQVWWGTALAWMLEKIDPGHCAQAEKHAQELINADDKIEK